MAEGKEEHPDELVTQDGRKFFLIRTPWGSPLKYISEEEAEAMKRGMVRPKFPRILDP